MLGGEGRTGAAGRGELCPATVIKPPDLPKMSISGGNGGISDESGGREAEVASAGCSLPLSGGKDHRGPATLSLPSDQIFIRAGAPGPGKRVLRVDGGRRGGVPPRPVGARMIKRSGNDKL